MIRIIVDPQTFITQEFGGISRYFTELCKKLNRSRIIDLCLPLLYTDNIHYIESPFLENSYQNRKALLIKYSYVFRNYLPRKLKKKSTAETIKKIKEQQFDLFIPTYYDTYFLPYLKEKPFVLTVHDMIHEFYPEYFQDDINTVPDKKKLIEKARRIIAVSENTRRDILKIYPDTPPEKIDVVYLAHQFGDNQTEPITLPDHYILFVGNRTFYKNFTLFATALAPLFKKYADLHLVCAGGNSFDKEELALLDELKISPKVIQRNFKDNELRAYYEKARCFVFPSAYEGFGIPILESMSAGCPIVLTNNSSFPEIAGDAGIYFELNDEDDLREKVEQVWNNEQLRSNYRERGIIQAEKFSWDKTTEETILVYQKALKL
jgi:glycosyltransferase involved in cell wall biosynthesis